nr:initiation-specific alpha-1,6-mannosyltransferase [Quercus suber]
MKAQSHDRKDFGGYLPNKSSNLSVPKQIRRSAPALLTLVLLLFLFANPFNSSKSSHWGKRDDLFPRKIWQTWKVDPFGFEEKNSDVAKTWVAKNPAHRYEVLTDQNDMAYVEHNFGPDSYNRPDIIWVYRELKDRIIKADLLRYLVMYVEGGVYTDIDVEALRGVDRFIPDRFREGDVDMVVGVEIDEPDFVNHPLLGLKCQSFCQWTFMCKPQLPVMMALVENIIMWLKSVATEQNCSIADIKLDFDQVISGTGPSAFTKAILADMSRREGRPVMWNEFHALTESKLLGGVLVLTVEAFAAGQGHSDSGNHDTKHALIKHHYHASKWPESHPRYNHPVYGEVEKCNWIQECVDQWDADKAAFEKLGPEEQQKQIEVAVAERKKLEEEERMREEMAEGLPGQPPNPIFGEAGGPPPAAPAA